MIRLDHAHVQATFHRFHPGLSPSRKGALGEMVCLALEIHAQLEEEIFYPALQALAGDLALLRKSFPEHAEMRTLIARLRSLSASDPAYDTTLNELMRDVVHHVADEETTLLPAAERLLADRLQELGARMAERRVHLTWNKGASIASSAFGAWPDSMVLLAAGAIAAPAYLLDPASLRGTRRS